MRALFGEDAGPRGDTGAVDHGTQGALVLPHPFEGSFNGGVVGDVAGQEGDALNLPGLLDTGGKVEAVDVYAAGNQGAGGCCSDTRGCARNQGGGASEIHGVLFQVGGEGFRRRLSSRSGPGPR